MEIKNNSNSSWATKSRRYKIQYFSGLGKLFKEIDLLQNNSQRDKENIANINNDLLTSSEVKHHE